MMLRITLLYVLLNCVCSISQEVYIGLYSNVQSKKISIHSSKVGLKIISDSLESITINPGIIVQISVDGDETSLNWDNKIINVSNLSISSVDVKSEIEVQCINPKFRKRVYYGELLFKSKNEKLSIINKIPLEKYIENVVQSEGGYNKSLEYYKVQSILSRTYALKNLKRHQSQGFSLCDEVHCQAYHSSKVSSSIVHKAVELTSGIIIRDSSTHNLTDALYHANCGGQTSRSDFVWQDNIHGLQPFIDTFCIHTKQSHWEKKIFRHDWINFFVNNYYFPFEDSLQINYLLNFRQDERKIFFISPHLGIPLKEVRKAFQLNSTYFSCYENDEYITLRGRGFGHGVGMCQEGAMYMANYGFNYQQIIFHYFNKVYFDVTNDDFMKQKVALLWDF